VNNNKAVLFVVARVTKENPLRITRATSIYCISTTDGAGRNCLVSRKGQEFEVGLSGFIELSPILLFFSLASRVPLLGPSCFNVRERLLKWQRATGGDKKRT